MSTKYSLIIAITLIIAMYRNVHLRWYRSAPDRIAALGYNAQIHKITTIDGYILELHRIPFSPENEHTKSKRQVILFVHGIFSSSDCFLLNGVQNSLAFQAANEGYDVWLLNLRGNRYSSNHVNLSMLSMEFWSFTFHEMAIFDLPAAIDYIIKTSGQQTIHYVGHSMASHIYLALLSEKPEYNSVIETGHLLTAGINPAETSLSLVYIGDIALPLINFLDYGSFGIHLHFTPLNYFLWFICQTPLIKTLVANMMGIFGGPSSSLNMTSLPDLFATLPNGSSARNAVHLGQGSIRFRQFDYGEKENRKRYGSDEPPSYNVTNVEVPTYIHYGGRDNLVAPSVIDPMIKMFREGSLKKVFIHEEFSHVDFYASMESKTRVNDVIFEVIRKY